MEKELFLKELFEENAFEDPVFKEEIFAEGEFEHGEEPFEHEEKDEHEENLAYEEALFSFAKAVGKKPEEISEIMRKGNEFDELSEKFGETKGDSEIFEKLAEIRGISKEEMKNEILWALEKATVEKMAGEIMAENPGMNRETARELANFRLEMNKAKDIVPEEEASEAMLLELENFLAKHSGEGIEKLSGNVVEEWEGGIPLETAFEKYRLFKENEELLEEIEKLKNEKMKEAQKIYAKEHSTGSATSAAGIFGADEFAAGLFKEY